MKRGLTMAGAQGVLVGTVRCAVPGRPWPAGTGLGVASRWALGKARRLWAPERPAFAGRGRPSGASLPGGGGRSRCQRFMGRSGEDGGAARVRGIYDASVIDVRGCLENLDALGWRRVKRRERCGPGVGVARGFGTSGAGKGAGAPRDLGLPGIWGLGGGDSAVWGHTAYRGG